MVSKRLTDTDPPRAEGRAEPRPTRRASTEMAEYRPVQISAIGGPALAGVPGNPVMAHDPDSACANRSYARLCESGPPDPKPSISTAMRSGCRSARSGGATPYRDVVPGAR